MHTGIAQTWSSRNEKLICVTLATSLFLFFAFQLVQFAFTTSATVDEPEHLLGRISALAMRRFRYQP